MTDTTQAPSTEESTTETPAPAVRRTTRRGGGLGGKVIAELQEIAAELGIEGATSMRKGALIEAIKAARGDAPTAPKQAEAPTAEPQAAPEKNSPDAPKKNQPTRGQDEGGQQPSEQNKTQGKEQNKGDKPKANKAVGEAKTGENQGKAAKKPGEEAGEAKNGEAKGNADADQNGNQNGNDDDPQGRRRNRRGRGRGGRTADGEVQVAEDDVLVPAAGIVDILDNYAFVRTTGYLPSENDVYVSLSMVRKWGLRRGDAVVGQVRQPREGERKEKFNPMVRVDSVNGMSLEEAKQRAEFAALTPVFPTERLRLAAGGAAGTGTVVDLVAPVGKGQRGLLVAPPASGATTALREFAEAVTTNHSECHLMVVLVDERPEEITEFQRSVRGEVIASAFDRAPGDHTTVAELAVERAKRLVELGHDVVVLFDGLTRLGRAYHQVAAGQNRVLVDGADASALSGPKRIFGAARNIEDGGSLTILATAQVETWSGVDESIYSEIAPTATTQVRLDRALAARRAFPAVDVSDSGTRRDDLLQSADEIARATQVRRAVADAESAEDEATILAGITA
ncbi:MAG: transcription termination factor Rho [Aeromicrobium sp.]|uniref:transcription termination factor Rho n=1 Tax=Aeromicrobium sp. TaxID=1871063 RepID=UPI0039E35550